MTKKGRVYTYFTLRVRFNNAEEKNIIKALRLTKGKNALVKNLLSDYLQSK